MFTRIPLLAALLAISLLPTLPATITTNPFPFDAIHSATLGEVIVTSSGWLGPVLDPAGTAPGQVSRVQRYNWATGALTATIDIGPYYDGTSWATVSAGVCEVPGALIVCNAGSASELVRIDTASNTVTHRWPMAGAPYHCVRGPDGNVWVTLRAGGQVLKVNPVTGAVLATVSVPGGPWRMALLGSTLLVTRFHDDALAWIDTSTATVTHTTPVGDQPNDVCIDPDYPVVYTSNYGGSVSIVSTASRAVVQTIALPAGSGPHGISRIGDELWVILSNHNAIQVWDPFRAALKRTHATGWDPSFGCVTPGSFWYANPLADRVGILPTAHVW